VKLLSGVSKYIWAIFEALIGFVIWHFIGYWAAQIYLANTDPSVNLPISTRKTLRICVGVVFGVVAALLYARRALDVYDGVGKPGQGVLTGKGGRPQINGWSVLTFWLLAFIWAFWMFVIQSQGHH